MKMGQGFRHGENGDSVDVLAAALGFRVEKTHGVQLVPKEFRPDGLLLGGGIDIHNTAPDGKLPRALHQAAAAIAGIGEAADKGVDGVLPAHLQGERGAHQDGFGHGAQAQGFPSEDLHRGFPGGEII